MENNNPKIPYTVTMDITIQVKMLVDSEDSFQASKDGARFLIGELSTESFHLDSFYDKVTLKDIKVTDCQYLGKVEKPAEEKVLSMPTAKQKSRKDFNEYDKTLEAIVMAGDITSCKLSIAMEYGISVDKVLEDYEKMEKFILGH